MTNDVIHYEKAFPFAINSELHKVHEIRLESNGDITSVYNSLTSQFPEKFDRLIRIEEIDTSMHVYDPIDNMWALTQQEPDRWLWHLKKIQADLAWDITKGDPNIRTAVIDTKFDITHPDLVSKISPNYDPFTLEEHVCISSESDWDKHGTTVASLVAAQTTEQGNTIEGQLASVGFNTMMVAYHTDVTKVFLQKALHASIIEGVDVIVSCAGGSLRCSPFDAEIERLVVNEILNNGTVIVMPAGNGANGSSCGEGTQPFYPFNPIYDERIIVVSSTSKADHHQYFDNGIDFTHSHFSAVDICAPGYILFGAKVTFCGALEWPYFGNNAGTSFASPIVAGVCALLKSINPDFTPGEIQHFIKSTADPIIDEYLYPGLLEAGRVNAFKAVKLADSIANNCMPIEISSNQSWDSNQVILCGLLVKSGSILTISSEVKFSVGSRIVIEPGASVIVDGGVLTSLDNYWQGIEVWGNSSASQHPIQGQPIQQGKLILNNATIENAICAVSLWKEGDYTKTGGIVQATNTIFRNNTKAVHIQPYRNFNPYFPNQEMDYLASFTNCTFELDNEYMGTHNFFKHVDLNRVKGVKFNSCNFSLADNVQSASPWNSAIASYSAGFSVIAPAGQTSSFSGFQSAIYAANTGMNTYSFFVNRAHFDNNAIGINAKWMNNAAVINSTFNIGNGNYTAENCYYGIRLEQSSGFAIEENQFGKQENSPQANLIGISVVNSLGVEDIYRNTFAGLSAGNYAYGKNYMSNGIGGLSYTCNTNSDNYADIYVYGTTSEHGIQSLQGSFSQPAGNIFSPNATWNLYNGTRRLIGYYYNTNAALQYPAFVEYVVREGVSANNACPSHYGGNNETLTLTASQKQALESEYLTSMNRFDAVQSLYSNLTDGGDTEGSLNDIATAQSGDMWALRARLLGASPHVSQEVLLAVADHTEVFTEAAIFDILAANPDELRNNELIEYLGQKEIPLPEYMIDILRQVAEGTTYKTVLHMQMAKHSHDKARAAHDMLRSILNEESPDMIQLRNWLHNLGGLSAERQIVASFIQEGRYSEAFDLANTLPMVYALQGEALNEHNNFVAMLLLNQNMQEENRGLKDLTEDETAIMNNFAVNDNGLAGTLARSIVETISGQPFANCPSLQGESSFKTGAVVNPNLLGQNFGLSLSVKPNPANSWTAFDYAMPEGTKDARIEIASPAGAVIESIPLSSIKGQKLFDSRKLSPGVYNCTLFAGAFSQTVKLIIQH